jgi:uncharacterized membrane protein HdeD (DUF308 family)
MTQKPMADVASTMLTRIGRHWGWILGYGIVTLAAGIAALVWPAVTLLAVAVLFGVQLIFFGVFRFVSAFATEDESGGHRVLMALLGVLALIIGLYALRHVLLTIVALALLLGIFWVVNGATELFAALSRHETAQRGWVAFMGVLSLIAGIILLVYPAISVVVLAVVVGVWLVVFGLMEIRMALRLRSLSKASRVAAT